MKHNFDDIQLACEYVSSMPPSTNTAILSRQDGRIYYLSEFGDSDEDVPDDINDSKAYVVVPHRHDLELGVRLVHRFVRESAPDLSDPVRRIFSRKGAYARYKDLLQERSLLDSWYAYEEAATRAALTEWCQANHIALARENSDDGA